MTTLRGISYPVEIDNGSLKLAIDTDLLRGHILSVLQTEPFERVMNPGYGTPDLLFNAVPDISLIAQYVRQSLERELPEIEFGVLARLGEDGAANLTIAWSVDSISQPPLQFRLAS